MSSGKRLEQLSTISDEQFALIENSWKQKQIDRLTIDQIVGMLDRMIDDLKENGNETNGDENYECETSYIIHNQ